MDRVSRIFLNGLMIVVPIGFTILIVLNVLRWIEALFGSYLPPSVHFPGMGIIILLILIMIAGQWSSNWVFKKMLAGVERFIEHIPVIKFIYSLLKRFSTAVFESETIFKQAVLIPYPNENSCALGFVMGKLSKSLREPTSDDHVCVFIPFSLNMTAGINLILPRDKVVFLDVSNESALEYIITAGTVMPKKG